MFKEIKYTILTLFVVRYLHFIIKWLVLLFILRYIFGYNRNHIYIGTNNVS